VLFEREREQSRCILRTLTKGQYRARGVSTSHGPSSVLDMHNLVYHHFARSITLSLRPLFFSVSDCAKSPETLFLLFSLKSSIQAFLAALESSFARYLSVSGRSCISSSKSESNAEESLSSKSSSESDSTGRRMPTKSRHAS
jgi:hypothetical protein